jgi:hypothetical protein
MSRLALWCGVPRVAVRSGRNTFSCAKYLESKYKDGKLPFGRTLAGHHQFVTHK